MTIDDAIKSLSPAQGRAIKKAFLECGVMDIYDGVLTMYLQVIHQRIRDKNEEIKSLQEKIKEAQRALSS